MCGGAELIASDAIEGQSGQLTEEVAQPNQMKRNRSRQQQHYDPSEVYVDHHHDVETSEQLQLLQA